jgi:hypothetical protein
VSLDSSTSGFVNSKQLFPFPMLYVFDVTDYEPADGGATAYVGAAYVYETSDGGASWDLAATLAPNLVTFGFPLSSPGEDAGHRLNLKFGYSVAADGDRIAVGAINLNSGQWVDAGGYVFVFERSTFEAISGHCSGYANFERFCPSDDPTCNGWDTQVVGHGPAGDSVAACQARCDANAWGLGCGGIYFKVGHGCGMYDICTASGDSENWDSQFYVRLTGGARTWTQTAVLKAGGSGDVSGQTAADWFGHSVALSGDVLAVGAPLGPPESRGETQDAIDYFRLRVGGAAYVFTHDGGTRTWTQTREFTSAAACSDSCEAQFLGHCAYWIANAETWRCFHDLYYGHSSLDQCAAACVPTAAMTADTCGDVYDAGGTHADMQYWNSATGTRIWFVNPCVAGRSRSPAEDCELAYAPGATSADDFYGWAVALKGQMLVVGSKQDSANAGAACVWRTSDGGATFANTARLTPDAGDTYFGNSVATDGDLAVVGSPFPSSTNGRGYVYQINNEHT